MPARPVVLGLRRAVAGESEGGVLRVAQQSGPGVAGAADLQRVDLPHVAQDGPALQRRGEGRVKPVPSLCSVNVSSVSARDAAVPS